MIPVPHLMRVTVSMRVMSARVLLDAIRTHRGLKSGERWATACGA